MKLRPQLATSSALLGLLFGAVPSLRPALAQQDTTTFSQPDLVPVMLWTVIAALGAMGVLSLGYLYRRTRGEPDEVIPKTVDPYYVQEGRVEAHATGELHPEMAHDAVGRHADQSPTEDGRERAVSNLTAPEPNLPRAEARAYEAGAPPRDEPAEGETADNMSSSRER